MAGLLASGVPFAPESVRFGKGEEALQVVEPFAGNPDRNHMKKYVCPDCGEVMYNTSAFGLRVIDLELVKKGNGGVAPEELQPTAHLNYEDRVKDVEDDLPKFADLPAEFGGSGVVMDNQGNPVVTPE